jgi:hypothetical protein
VTGAVAWLKDHKIDVALIGMQYARRMADDPHYQAMRMAVREVAKEQAVLRIGRYDAVETIQKIRLQRGEPATETELTEAGYVCMAEYLARAIAIGLFARMRTPGANPSADPPAKTP